MLQSTLKFLWHFPSQFEFMPMVKKRIEKIDLFWKLNFQPTAWRRTAATTRARPTSPRAVLRAKTGSPRSRTIRPLRKTFSRRCPVRKTSAGIRAARRARHGATQWILSLDGSIATFLNAVRLKARSGLRNSLHKTQKSRANLTHVQNVGIRVFSIFWTSH